MAMNNKLERKDIETILALTPLQEGVLFHYLEQPGSEGYFEQLRLRLQGDISSELFSMAWNDLARNNEMLRTVFRWEKLQTPVQIVLKNYQVPIYQRDLSNLAQNEQIQAIEQYCQEDVKQGIDLTCEPFRVSLLKLADQEYEMVISNHHILYDGWSNGIILKEFFQAYQQRLQGEEPLEVKKPGFQQFIKWIKSQDQKAQQKYWASSLAGYEPKTFFPSGKEFERKVFTYDLSAEIQSKLENLAQREQTTLATLLYAAWGILLQRYCNTDDVVFGTTVAGRTAAIPEIENMVGLFINTIPLRVNMESTGQIRDLIQAVDQSLQARREFESTPLVDIKASSGIDYLSDLFDSIMVIENYPLDASLNLAESPLTIESYTNFELTNYDLTFVVNAFDQMSFKLIYNGQVLPPERVEALTEHYVNILQRMIVEQSTPLREVQFLTEEELALLLHDWNDTQAGYPDQKVLHQIFEEQVRETPERIALTFEEEELTYQELNQRANRLARVLRKKGLQPDQLVGIMVERSVEMVVGLLAILKAGGAYLPLDPIYPQERIAYMLEDSQAQILLADTKLLKEIDFHGEVINLMGEFTESTENLENVNQARDLAYLLYTSGTTGNPKGVMIEHRNVIRLLINDQTFYDFSQDDVWTMFHSFCFDISVWEMYGALLFGGRLVMVPALTAKDATAFSQLLRREKVTILNQTPTAFYALEEAEMKQTDTSLCLRYIIFAGEALKPIQLKDWHQRYPNTKLINMYGITETTVHSTFKEITDYEIKHNISNVGVPIPTLTTYIMDKDMNLLPPGLAGELYVGGEGVARGYFQRPELTAERFVENKYKPGERLYRSGDQLYYLPDGEMVYGGRIDQQVKIRGFRVELGDITAHLLEHEQVKEAVVLLREDGRGDKLLCAYIVSEGEVQSQELREYLGRKLPEYMVPTYFVHLEQIPLTSNGKADKRALNQIPLHLAQEQTEVEPRTQTEAELAQIWREILDLETVSVTSNFFEIGGHSIKATRLAGRIHKHFDVQMPLQQIFALPTIRQMAEFIEEASQVSVLEIQPMEQREYYPVSSAQKRVYVMNQLLAADETIYNMPGAVLVKGKLERQQLHMAVRELMQRHEILRSSFRLIEGEIVQIVHEQLDFQPLIYQGTEGELDQMMREFVQPFDLGQAPLFRVGLVELAQDQELLLFDAHHIIADGTAMSILIDEFVRLYQGNTLPELPFQYKDFAYWQQEQNRSGALEEQEQFWLELFADEIPVLNLPVDEPRPSVTSFAGDLVKFSLDQELTAKIKELAHQNGATLYMSLLAIYNVLLAKYSGQNDLVVGSPVEGRSQAGLEKMIGMFVNTLAMRNQPKAELSFREFLAQVRENALKAYEHQDYQFEALVEKLDLEREMGRSPLFDTMFALQNMDSPQWNVGGIQITPYEFENTEAKFDIVVEATEVNGGIDCKLYYRIQLFKRATMERFVRHFTQIASEVVANPEQKLAEIKMITAGEKEQLLYDFNRGSILVPEPQTIQEIFQQRVQKNPDKIALVYADEELTYGELNSRANHLAHHLRKYGVGPDQVVGLLLDRSVEMIVGILAILKAGGAYLPIDPTTPEERIQSMLQDSNAVLLLTKEGISEKYSYINLTNFKEKVLTPKVNCRRPQIQDLDNLPIPNRALINYEKYNQYIGQAMVKNAIAIQATRGCPYNCAYCHKIWPKSHIIRSAESIFDELMLYYNMGVRRFIFVDDIFNLDKKNSTRFFEKVVESGIQIQIFFPNGLRGDILTKEYIDLMVQAGTVNMALALETASPRLQKLIGKNLQLERFKANVQYILETYPHVIVELFTMHGFPTETEEEALQTLEMIKSLKWVHFPYVHILKIFAGTDMAEIAMGHGVSLEQIEESLTLAYHELPTTLPFAEQFTRKYQAEFLNGYFLAKERLLHVLPYQLQTLTEDELLQKYNSYLPIAVGTFDELLNYVGITRQELGEIEFLPDQFGYVPDLNAKMQAHFTTPKPDADALRVLLLDLSQHFSTDGDLLYDVVEPPLGLMYLLTYLQDQLGSRVTGKIAKSRADFDSFAEFKQLLEEFKPDVIGIRSLSFYRDHCHQAIGLIRQWGIDVPIVLGGPYGTSSSGDILKDQNIDLVVLGEGEVTFAELITEMIKNNGQLPDRDLLEQIEGIAYRDLDQIEETSQVDFQRDILLLDHLPEMKDGEDADLPIINQPSDLAYVIYTSGSTGKPKGVMIEHHNVNHLVAALHESIYANYEEDLNVALVAPYVFDASVQQIFAALQLGHTLHIVPEEARVSGKKLLEFYNQFNIQISDGTPIHLSMMLTESALLKEHVSVQHFLIGGEALQRTVVKEFLTACPEEKPTITNVYGPTECTVDSTSWRIQPADLIQSGSVPIGQPLGNAKLYILDANYQVVPLGVPGEIFISGAGVGRGYLNRPDLTVERFIINPHIPGEMMYRTGDVGRWLPDGRIEFIGRMDHQVKVRGYRIELGEIEHQLLNHPSVREANVRVTKNPEQDQYICAYYVAESELSKSELRDFLSKNLPGYMIPSYFIYLDKMPMTVNGKVDPKRLPAPDLNWAGSAEYVAPANLVEQRLVEAWTEILGVEGVGTKDNFFELGGHSLKTISLSSWIQKEFKVEIPLATMFKLQTIQEQAACIMNAEQGRFKQIELLESKGVYFTSSAQKRIYALQQLAPESTAYNIPFALLVEGEFDHRTFERAFAQLIQRHETLRTSFSVKNDQELVQKVHEAVEFQVEEVEAVSQDVDQLLEEFIRPFDLTQAPLLRVGVAQKTTGQRIVLVDLHHIIADGASMKILTDELIQLYQGQQPPALRVQYKEYANWHNQLLDSQAMAQEESYWIELCTEPLPKLNLPTDFPRPAVKTNAGEWYKFKLEPELATQVINLAYQSGVTLNTLLLAAYQVLLYRYSGQSDLIIGLPVLGRTNYELEQVVGMFVNTVLIRSQLQSDQVFSQHLVLVQESLLKTYEYQNYPFEKLIEKLKIKPDLSRNPIFDTMFSYQSQESPEIDLGMVKFIPYEQENKTAKFDLSLHTLEMQGEIQISLEYATDLFREETMKQLAADYSKVLESIVANPDQSLNEIELETGYQLYEEVSVADLEFNF